MIQEVSYVVKMKKCQLKKKAKIQILFLLVLLIPFVSAQFYILDEETIINTTVSNSSMTFSTRVFTNKITVENDSITLDYVAYNIGGVEYFCDSKTFITPNSNLDSADFGCPIVTGQSNPGSGATSYDLPTTINPCPFVYDFIVEHYNNTLDYLVYEFEDLKDETNLTTDELKDYLLNFQELCDEELPFDYDPVIKEIKEKVIKDKVLDNIKSIFKEPKYILGLVILILIALFGIKSLKKK